MKKIFLVISSILILNSTVSMGQVLINSGFETWTNLIIFSEPTGYVSSNYASILLGTGGLPTPNVSKSTTKHGGTYSAKLNSYAQNVGDTTGIPGLMITGALDIANTTIKPGFPYNGRPLELKGFYKYAEGVSPDSGIAAVSFMKYNLTTGSSDVIGAGFGVFSNKANFTEFSIPIAFINGEMPDTAIIIFSTSSSFSLDTTSLLNAPVGSVLYLDDLSFFGTASGLESIDDLLKLSAYPNPATDNFQIKFNQSKRSEMSYTVRDIFGKLLLSNAIEANEGSNSIEISLENFANGVYSYQLLTNDGIVSKQFIISR